jgi:hypothetical protein
VMVLRISIMISTPFKPRRPNRFQSGSASAIYHS